ncbi:MAG: tyrosine-type recombinase/integrase [Negativicutes bacterium]|jgi:integrase
MRKRGNNEGSVTKRGDKYLVQITIGYDETGKQVKKSRVAATAAEAREVMRELQDTYSCSLNIDDMILLKDWAAKCLETYIKPRVRPNTYTGYFYNAKKYIVEHPLGRVRLGKFRAIQLQELLNDIPGSPHLKKQVRHIYHQIFRYAADNGIIQNNPIKNIIIPQIKGRDIESIDLPLGQITKALQAYPMYYTAFMILSYTGMRRSELLGLTWADFNRAKRTLRVNKAVIIGEHSQPVICDTKTNKSNRSICIPEELCKIIENYRDNSTVLNKQIIHNDGRLYNPGSFNKAISRRAGVHIRVHDLRHLYASFLVQNDVNMKIVQEQMGHNDYRVTMNTYAHLKQEAKIHAADVISKLFL